MGRTSVQNLVVPSELPEIRRHYERCLISHEANSETAWPKTYSLHSSSLKTADLDALYPQVAAWSNKVRREARDAACELEFRRRSIGTGIELPVRIIVPSPEAEERLLGSHGETQSARGRVAIVREAFPGAAPAAVAKALKLAKGWDSDRFEKALSAAKQIAQRKEADWLTARQVPLQGIEAKFLDSKSNRSFIEALAGEGCFDYLLVLHRGRCEFRYLDPSVPYGSSFAIWVQDASDALAYQPSKLLVVENLDVYDNFPELDEALIVLGGGHGAVAKLALLPFLESWPEVLYWGDIDAAGFEILSEVRLRFPRVRSVLMDAHTLQKFNDYGTNTMPDGTDLALWKAKETPGLTQEERELYVRLTSPECSTHRRLEQERIPLSYALKVIDGVSH